MAILSRGQSFASGDQVTAQKLQDIVDLATFDDPADESTIVKDSGTGKLKVPSNGIGSNELASDASVDANRAVDTDHIKDDAVTAGKLQSSSSVDANRAVTTNHIKDGAVTSDKLNSTGVTAATYTNSTIEVDAKGRITSASSGSPIATIVTNSNTSTSSTANVNTSVTLTTGTWLIQAHYTYHQSSVGGGSLSIDGNNVHSTPLLGDTNGTSQDVLFGTREVVVTASSETITISGSSSAGYAASGKIMAIAFKTQ